MIAIVKVLYSETQVRHSMPKNIKRTENWAFDSTRDQIIQEIHYRVFRNVRLVHNLLFHNHQFIKEYCTFEQISRKRIFLSLFKSLLFRKKRIKKGILALSSFGTNYHHFLADVLPTWFLVKNEKLISESSPLILPEYYLNYPYIIQALNILNIPIEVVPTHIIASIEDVIIFKAPRISHFNPLLFNDLRSFLFKEFPSSGSKLNERIFISRAKASRRKITNEDLVVQCLLKYGFRILHTEDLSLLDQIEIFRSCKILVGMHGAGLSNMIFMPDGSKVLEFRALTSETGIYNIFWHLSSACNVDFYYQLCQTTNATSTNKFADVQVDENELHSLLQEICLKN